MLGSIFFTSFATRKVKSGLSTENKISGLNSNIFWAVSFIFFLILNKFSNTRVKPKYVTSLKFEIEFIPKDLSSSPPKQR